MHKMTRENQGYFDRLQRAESWIERAQAIEDWEDYHGQFIFYWIAWNALYGRERADRRFDDADMRWFLGLVCDWDQPAICNALSPPLKRKADNLIKDKFLCEVYWEQGTTRHTERAVDRDYEDAQKRWGDGKTSEYLGLLFRRLRVLRNQIFHGCSTDRRSLNKPSLVPAVELLGALVPTFLDVTQRCGKGRPWPGVPYPRKGSPLNPDS